MPKGTSAIIPIRCAVRRRGLTPPPGVLTVPAMAKILLIDDDDAVRDLLRRQAERSGHEVFELISGEGAEQAVEEFGPDLIVTDILMPERDGIETIMGIRQVRPDIRIIAISGGGARGDLMPLKIAERLGAFCTLKKPFSRAEFEEALAAALDA